MRNVSNIYILFLFVTFCCSYYDVPFVHFYLHSKFLINLVLTSMLGRWSAMKERVTRKSTRNTRNITRSNTQFAGILGEL